nr:serine/threonine-protein kinase DCLK3 [Vulpes vulpes]
MGKEPLTLKNIQVAMEELYPSKARALTLTQHSRAPSPRLRSRLHSKALRGGHHCGEMEAAKSCGEAALSKAAIRHQEAPVEPGLGDRARPQKKWGGGKWESELGGRPPREATLERPASGEKHLDVEIERTSGEIIRCDKCKRERELQQGLQRERLSLGPSELDLGKCHRDAAAAEKLGRARSCRRSPEANPAAGEGGWQGEGPRSSPRNPTQELRRPARNPDAGDEEDRDPEGQGGHAPAAKAKREQGQAPPAREGALRDARREAREAREAPSSCRSRRGAWRSRGTRQAYAMKIIDKAKLRGKEDMVDSEILITRSLSHPNIVQLHEVYETEGEVYLILEYVRGGDLFDAITESVRFAEREAALLLLDLCRALAHLHDQGIVHRDLKPENLLVQRNEDKSTTLKLADFGLAKHVVRPIFTVCGTPTYVAPEILSEKGYGLEVDMWAAGVILYILLCGFPPFRSPERDQDELFNIIQLGHFEFLAPYWDNISDAAKDLVSRLLVVDPKKRYTAHQVLQHPWIETAGKTSMVNLQKEMPSSNEGHVRSQHKRPAEQAL